MQKREPIAKSSVADNKVSNKFSRYDSDSSSDEDEEHTVKKPSPGDGDGDALESDAESVTSDRYVSSGFFSTLLRRIESSRSTSCINSLSILLSDPMTYH